MNDIKTLEVSLKGQRVGTLALTPENRCAFQYDTGYIRSGVSISPFGLPLTGELFIAKPLPFDGGFGVFDDGLPDGWGRLVMDRYFRSQGLDPERMTVLQRLSIVGAKGRGALEYKPSSDVATEEGEAFSYHDFEKTALGILVYGREFDMSIDALYKYSGSSGGARPKAFIREDGREWIVKFRAAYDPVDVGKEEYEYSLLAKRCGIEMAATRLFENKYFGTERFDRTPEGKVHVISAAALLNADYRAPSLDYLTLLNACRILTGSMSETEALFRVMVFNVLIRNRDDHAKNFAFRLSGAKWRLAPAYDLLPSYGFGGHHTTTVNGSGDPKESDIFAVSGMAGISGKTAKAIYGEVRDVLTEKEASL